MKIIYRQNGIGYLFSVLFSFFGAFPLLGQPIPDTTYPIQVRQSAYKYGKGPLIFIDEAHNNLHKAHTGFLPFKKLLEMDGYRVEGNTGRLDNSKVLNNTEILVIANAIHEINLGNWILPTPSAFTQNEIKQIKSWVKKGGNLLLIADHMPFAVAAHDLAQAFGFVFLNGFAYTEEDSWPPSVFALSESTLISSDITKGMKSYELIENIASFSGSAFTIPEGAIPVLKFTDEHYSLQPDTAWHFNENTPLVKLKNYYQGAVLKYGKGKVAIFGEAAMFTAQKIGDEFVGFNSPNAPDNVQFILNLIHWLDGVKEYEGVDEYEQISAFKSYFNLVQADKNEQWNYAADTVKLWFDNKENEPVLLIKGNGFNGRWKEWDDEMNKVSTYDSLWYDRQENAIKGYFYENNDFYKLIGKSPTKTMRTFWLNEKGKIEEILIYWIPEENKLTGEYLKPVVAWAMKNEPEEIQYLYADEQINPSRENAIRWKSLLKKYIQSTCQCCTEAHDAFDFWLGDWNVYNEAGKLVGTNKLVKLQNNCLIQENWTGTVTGTSFNYYDTADSTWNQLWISSNGNILKLKGNAINHGVMVLKSDILEGEKGKYYNKITWTANDDGSVTQYWEVLNENDERIADVFKGIYRRKE